jgi:hypothetical protein
MIIVINNTSTIQVWCGQEIASEGQYQIQAVEQLRWSNNEIFLEALGNGSAIINDGYNNLSIGVAINLLKQIDIFNRDSESNPYFKQIFADSSKKFTSRAFVFTTGKYQSLYNKNSELTDLNDGELVFFNASYVQLVKGESESIEDYQVRLDEDCKFTWLYFTSLVAFGISKGRFMYRGTPAGEFHNWLEFAPHIPKAYGGSVPCLDGGFPLDMMGQGEFYEMDGCACLIIPFDEVYYTHRIGHKIEHETGDKIKIVSIFDIYT